jgi:hypothetical protein
MCAAAVKGARRIMDALMQMVWKTHLSFVCQTYLQKLMRTRFRLLAANISTLLKKPPRFSQDCGFCTY